MLRVACLLMAVLAARAAASAEPVRAYEGTRTILTGPFKVYDGPQNRLHEFRPVEYPAVFIENEYLRCVALPTLGGRLYEVFNKVSDSQLFFVNPYVETHDDDTDGRHPWNLGGIEVNFPYFHHGNTYNDRWHWATFTLEDGSAGVVMSHTSLPTRQRAVFRVMLRPGIARVDLAYRFENLNSYPWGLAAWIDTMHPKTMDTEFILPVPWVAGHGHNRSRTKLDPWPIRDGVDLSWQKNVPEGTSLSEFGFEPRFGFHGCYEHATDRGAVRIFDPQTLPAAKLWTQAPPITPDMYYQHFEIWTATSPVMEDPLRQAELSSREAADSWYQVWGIGGYVFATDDLALNLRRSDDETVVAGICGTRVIRDCVVSLMTGHTVFFRHNIDLDPARPWKQQISAPPGDVLMEVIAPDGSVLAAYELRTDPLPQEKWEMPEQPRWAAGINAAYYDEDYSVLWRWRGHFFDGAINRYRSLLKENPESVTLMLDLARCYLKDVQVRNPGQYRDPGPQAEADVAKRREYDLAAAVELLQHVIERQPHNAHAHLYLGMVLEAQGKHEEAAAAYRAALASPAPSLVAALHLIDSRANDLDPDEAADLARRVMLLYPQSTRARHAFMQAAIAAGHTQAAVEVGTVLHELDSSDPTTAALLSQAYEKLGKAQESEFFAAEAARLLQCVRHPQASEHTPRD